MLIGFAHSVNDASHKLFALLSIPVALESLGLTYGVAHAKDLVLVPTLGFMRSRGSILV